MTNHEQKLIRAVRILLNWGRKNDGIAPPFPVYHSYLSKVDGERLPCWRTPEYTSTNLFVQAHADGEEAVLASAEALLRDDLTLDPDATSSPHAIAVWLIEISGWGTTQYVATADEATDWLRYKARTERSTGSVQRRTGATPQEIQRYNRIGAHHLE